MQPVVSIFSMRRLALVLQNADLGNSHYKKAQFFFACGGQKVSSNIGMHMSLVALTVTGAHGAFK